MLPLPAQVVKTTKDGFANELRSSEHLPLRSPTGLRGQCRRKIDRF